MIDVMPAADQELLADVFAVELDGNKSLIYAPLKGMAFVANRPNKIANVSLDPVTWSMRMADAMSMGATPGTSALPFAPPAPFFPAAPSFVAVFSTRGKSGAPLDV